MAWKTHVRSADLTNGTFYKSYLNTDGSLLVVEPDPREIVMFHFQIISAVGEADDLDWQLLAGYRISSGNALGTVADAQNMDLAAADTPSADNALVGFYFAMTSGGETGELRIIQDSVTATDAIVLDDVLSGTPTLGETYDLYALHQIEGDTITAETAPTDALPQTVTVATSGYPLIIPRTRATAGTDAHITTCIYALDGVNA